jgi:hypothetical protein
MKTNDLKKGHHVMLSNGWRAVVADNKKGNIRLCEVHGHYTELGSVYAHDWVFYLSTFGTWEPIEHTKDQLKMQKTLVALDLI